MELFKVVNRSNKTISTFNNKMEAKGARDALNEELGDKVWRVTRGKDNLPSGRNGRKPSCKK